MTNYYNSLAGISQYGILPISPGNTSDVRRERVRRGDGEDEHTTQKRSLESADERSSSQRKVRNGPSVRHDVVLSRRSLEQQEEQGQMQGQQQQQQQQQQQPPQPGMRLGPSDPLPGPFFNLFDDDDDTEYEPGTEEEEEFSEEEIEDEEEMDPKEWMLDLDKDFALPQGYVLPPYSDLLSSELQMFAPEPVANEPGVNEPETQVPTGTVQSDEVTTTGSKPRFISTNHDIRYSVDPYHYTPSKTVKAQQSMRELLSQGRQAIESNRQHVTEDVSLKSLQEHYFNQLKSRNVDPVSMPLTTKQPVSRRGIHKAPSRKPHNAGTTSKDVGIELQCLHCDREFRGPKASTHRQQHIKRMHPDKYVKLKG